MERSGGHKAFQGLGEGAGAGREEMELLAPVQDAIVPDSCGEGKGRVWPPTSGLLAPGPWVGQ